MKGKLEKLHLTVWKRKQARKLVFCVRLWIEKRLPARIQNTKPLPHASVGSKYTSSMWAGIPSWKIKTNLKPVKSLEPQESKCKVAQQRPLSSHNSPQIKNSSHADDLSIKNLKPTKRAFDMRFLSILIRTWPLFLTPNLLLDWNKGRC